MEAGIVTPTAARAAAAFGKKVHMSAIMYCRIYLANEPLLLQNEKWILHADFVETRFASAG